jgi:protein required for attachment to host cells
MQAQEVFRFPNAPTCIAACSGSGARFWRSDARGSDWSLLKEFRHAAGTQREAEFASDRPGRSFDSFGSGRHSMSKTHSGRDQDEMRFADEVAEFLNRGVLNGDFLKIILFSDPTFLGLLRGRLSATTSNSVVFEAPKNLTYLEPSEIMEYFA